MFSTFFSSCANNIGQPDKIDMRELDFLINIIDRHENHTSILAIKEHHKDVPGFDFKPVKVVHVENLLHKLDVNKATGYDQIPSKMVKLCSKELTQTLTELVNNAFKQNLFRDDMKRAEVTQMFKKKDDMNKNNYMPVSILSVFSKVFETIVAEQLMAYFENIFNNLLCAYRKKYGCEHVLVLKHLIVYPMDY